MRPLAMIAAIGSNRVIGSDNDLMWHLPDDFRFFKETTRDHVVIMGRKTFDSMGKPLPRRSNYVLTRQPNLSLEGCRVFNTLQMALDAAYNEDPFPFVIGGGKIYQMAMPLATHLYLTHVDFAKAGETYFPELNDDEWHRELLDEHPVDERHGYAFKIVKYVRKDYK